MGLESVRLAYGEGNVKRDIIRFPLVQHWIIQKIFAASGANIKWHEVSC